MMTPELLREIEAALEPFSKWSDALRLKFADHPDEFPLNRTRFSGTDRSEHLLVLGDVRRAARALIALRRHREGGEDEGWKLAAFARGAEAMREACIYHLRDYDEAKAIEHDLREAPLPQDNP